MVARILENWSRFTYTLTWSVWVSFIDGWIPRLSMTVPVLGYLILFNDSVSDLLSFTTLAEESENTWGLKPSQRLRCLYFGLVFLGISNIIYRVKRPASFRLGSNLSDYTRNGLELFTSHDFLMIHNAIRSGGNVTTGGIYGDSVWKSFLSDAGDADASASVAAFGGDWSAAIRKHGDLLRGMLFENFVRYDRSRRWWLSFCLLFSWVGYILLVIPGVDLFIKVWRSSFL